MSQRTKNRVISVVLLVLIVAIFFACFYIGGLHQPHSEDSFSGTDSVVTDMLANHGVTPWFHPLFEPGSSEVESGLFALQAAMGAGLFGYLIGNLRGRSYLRRAGGAAQHDPEVAPTPEP